jgi:hypothetical protein
MNEQRDNPILEACLDEVLGGRTPPDLSARILQAWESSRAGTNNRAAAGIPLPPPLAGSRTVSAVEAPPVQAGSRPRPIPCQPQDGQPAVCVASRQRGVRSAARQWISIVAALCILVAGVAGGFWVLKNSGNGAGIDPQNIAKDNTPKSSDNRDQIANNPLPRGSNAASQVAPPKPETDQGPKSPSQPDMSQFVDKLPFGPPSSLDSPGHDYPIPNRTGPKTPNAELIAFMNESLKTAWQEYGVTPSPPATDAEWCRRTYLRIVGRIPTVEELKRYVDGRSSDKKERLVDELLTSDKYAEEYARHWTTFWTNVLIGRSGGTQPDDLASREGLQQYLRQALLKNEPYDRVVHELISASGSNQPGSEDFNGATNFFLASMDDKATLATARTSRIFLGKQLQCTQCHNHPANEWTQNQFWELNAFLRQMQVERDRESGTVRLVNQDFQGEGGDAAEAEVYYEQLSGRMKVAYPVFDGRVQLPRSGLIAEVDRREELAKLIVQSDDLGRSAVNRLWAHFFGFGFTRPVDDMGPHNPPSHPQLLERLAQEFQSHDYDMQDLIRWMALSDAFGRSSKVAGDSLVDVPEYGQQPLFSRYYSRQMQPEEVYESLMVVAQAHKPGQDFSQTEKARLQWLGQFTQNMGTDEGEETSTFQGNIRQSLIMMNGPLMQRAVSHEHGSLLNRVAQSNMSPQEKIEHLFLSAVARKPNKRESDLALKLYQDHKTNPVVALQDIWWALLNSNEFILDH